MDYKALREQGLEIYSGAVEGGVNYVMAKMFDSFGIILNKKCDKILY